MSPITPPQSPWSNSSDVTDKTLLFKNYSVKFKIFSQALSIVSNPNHKQVAYHVMVGGGLAGLVYSFAMFVPFT